MAGGRRRPRPHGSVAAPADHRGGPIAVGRQIRRLSVMNDRLEPRIRILLGSSIAIGHGRAPLLEAIAKTGSIAAEGRRMGMSYHRAWLLAKTMNDCQIQPLQCHAEQDP